MKRKDILRPNGWLYPAHYFYKPNVFFTTQLISKATVKKKKTGIVNFNFDSSQYPIVCHNWYPYHATDNYIYTWNNVPQIIKKEVYTVNNNISIKRVSDGADIPATSVNIQLDWNSFCWGLSFELLGKNNLNLIKPQNGSPTEVEVNVNGYIWHFYVESWNEQASFNSNTYTVSGRSIVSELDAPYTTKQAYSNSDDVSAKQMCETILQNTGWTLDWQIEDWLIKSGAFSIIETPIRAVLAITKTQKAVVYADKKDKVLHVKKRYKVKTWNLSGATPDIVVPENVILSLSAQYIPQIKYNGIYLVGTSKNGVTGLVKVSGTDGTPTMEQVSDALFTDTTVLQERGIVELCEGNGPYYKKTIAMPIMDNNLVDLADIVQITVDGIAYKVIATAITISANRNENGNISAAQTLEVLQW